jgi:hypothetical protein
VVTAVGRDEGHFKKSPDALNRGGGDVLLGSERKRTFASSHAELWGLFLTPVTGGCGLGRDKAPL